MAPPNRLPLLSYRRAGKGIPLVMLPAFPLSSRMWDAQIGELSKCCDVIAVDPRGFGESPPLGDLPCTLDVVADDVNHLMDHLGVDKVVIAGISMGGYETLSFVARYPERVSAMVLADTKATADTEMTKKARESDAVFVERTTGESPAEVGEAIFRRLCARLLEADSTFWPGPVRQRREWIRATDPASVAWALRAMANRRDTHDVLARTTVPVLIIAGEKDTVIDPTESVRMLDALPEDNGRLVLLEDANHLSNLEKSAEFSWAVGDWLTSLAGA